MRVHFVWQKVQNWQSSKYRVIGVPPSCTNRDIDWMKLLINLHNFSNIFFWLELRFDLLNMLKIQKTLKSGPKLSKERTHLWKFTNVMVCVSINTNNQLQLWKHDEWRPLWYIFGTRAIFWNFFIFENQMYLHKGHIAPRIFVLSLTIFKI